LTGTWGTGKSSLIEALATSVHVWPEHGRLLAAEGVGEAEFCSRMLKRSIGDYVSSRADRQGTLFDRGIPDCWAYARHFGIDEAPYADATERLRYRSTVFYCPVWPEIYVRDELRRADLGQAKQFDELLLWVYEEAGYELVIVAPGPVDIRSRFILSQIGPH
jgi:predicted ATPase